jgi:hypothetical protein
MAVFHPQAGSIFYRIETTARSKTSFEERLARLDPPQNAAAKQPPKPQKGLPKMIASIATLVIALTAGTVAVISTMFDDSLYVATATKAAEDELSGKWSLQRAVMAGDGGASLAMSLQVRRYEKQLASGTLSPEDTRQAQAFVRQYKGKTSADLMRGPMVGMLKYKALNLGATALAQEIEQNMQACDTQNCLMVLEAKYTVKLGQIETQQAHNRP